MTLPPNQPVAVVTGGSKGIGHASASELSTSGFSVAILGRDAMAGAAAVEKIRAMGAAAVFLRADVTDRHAVSTALGVLPRVDVLVNSAGAMSQKPFDEVEPEEFRRLAEVNLIGLLGCCQMAAARMGQGGRIINISSRAALGGKGLSHYAATKAGVIALTRCLAIELLPRGITVNAVAPGFIDTPLSRGALTPEQFEAFTVKQPMGRAGQPEDVSWAVAFLASPRASFITGQCLFVDGGKSLPV